MSKVYNTHQILKISIMKNLNVLLIFIYLLQVEIIYLYIGSIFVNMATREFQITYVAVA